MSQIDLLKENHEGNTIVSPLCSSRKTELNGRWLNSDLTGCLCSLGTGEIVHVLSFVALPNKIASFESVVQDIARSLYSMDSGITDVRVCHPQGGKCVFIITFVSKNEFQKFVAGPEKCLHQKMSIVCDTGEPNFYISGSLMPPAHTLNSLCDYLESKITGLSHTEHDVSAVGKELAKWYPRPEEYMQFVHWDENNPSRYTRNLIFANEFMDVLLMCWPPHSASAIHGHDRSSCWVNIVEGTVHEVQYATPICDKKFMEQQMKNPTGAVGRCGKLKVINVAALTAGGVTSTYANNDIGVHRIENRTDKPAYTLHVYAPGLRNIKIYKDIGTVCVHTVASVNYRSNNGKTTGHWGNDTHPDGVLDVDAWNNFDEMQ